MDELGTNVEVSREGDLLLIQIDLSKDFGQSKSGKTNIVASTGGNKLVPGTDNTFIGLNVYRK